MLAAEPTRQVSCKVNSARANKEKTARAAGEGAGVPVACGAPESPLADFGSVVGMAKCEVARKVGSAVRPARPIKKKAT